MTGRRQAANHDMTETPKTSGVRRAVLLAAFLLPIGLLRGYSPWRFMRSWGTGWPPLLLASFMCLMDIPYMFWNAYHPVPPGDIGRILQLLGPSAP